MLTDDEEDDYKNLNFSSSDKQIQLTCLEKEYLAEEVDLYQQIAEKDHYLLLAAEAGQVLLEKNKKITEHYQSLQTQYLHKIEELEQEKHFLKRELTDRDYNYESRMQELQAEFSNLSGQLHMVQKSSLLFERSNQSSFDDMAIQNSSLISELDEMKSYNKELSKQVKALSKRLDDRTDQFPSNFQGRMLSDSRNSISIDSMLERQDCNETRKLKEQVQRLLEEKLYLESNLLESSHEKDALTVKHETSLMKIAGLEREIHFLKLQIEISQESMTKIQRKNKKLRDRLQLCNSFHHQLPAPAHGVNKSLFEELELSLTDTDVNLPKMSTPKKHSDYENKVHENIQSEFKMVHQKLLQLQNKLLFGSSKDQPYENIDVYNADVLMNVVDQIAILIQKSALFQGLQINEDCDRLSQNESHISDRDIDALEQQVNDLNHRLNLATSSCENAKKDLSIAQASALLQENVLQSLQIKVNSQEREIASLRKEREIMLADISVEEKFRRVIQERDEALARENFATSKLEESHCDVQKLNAQLLTVVEQKFALSEQLEEWQFDMASLIDQQLTSKIKDEQWKSRKRSGSITPAKLLASKLFSSRNSSKNSSPKRVISPVQPKTK